MGWLRDLMGQREPPFGSFGRLAEHCLEHPSWPDYVRPQARSLAALFSKFDRRIELEWLQDRPDVQHVLVELLQCSPGDVLRVLDGGIGAIGQQQGRVRLPDAPLTRPLALSEEALPPGLPEILGTPRRWRQHLWLAPSPAEIELVWHWLKERALASCVKADGAAANFGAAELPVFCWLQGDQPPSLGDLPEASCVAWAATAEPPAGWALVQSGPVSTWAEAFVRWYAPRLPGDSHFDARHAVSWLLRAALEGWVDGLHAAAGLLAALDEVEFADAEGAVGPRVEQFVRQRLQRASIAERSEARWLLDNVLPALTGLMERLLAQETTPWDAPRSFDAWVALVPERLQQGVDIEWARKTLQSTTRGLSAHDLETAFAKVPPGAFRLIRGLEAAGLLQGESSSLRLAPRWLGAWLKVQAAERLLQRPLVEWGPALLQPGLASEFRRQLQAAVRVDASAFVERVLDPEHSAALEHALERPPLPASLVLAIETLFERVGHAVLEGASLEGEQIAAVWELHSHTWIQLDAQRVAPSLLCGARQPERFGAWVLSAWALSEALPMQLGHPLLHPWNSPEEVPTAALDAVQAYTDVASRSVRSSIQRLLGRLLLRAPTLLQHRLFLPNRLLSQPSWYLWLEANRDTKAIELALELAGQGAGNLAENVWHLWSNAGKDPDVEFLAPDAALAGDFWGHLPAGVLQHLLQTSHPFVRRLPYEHLREAQFGQLLLQDHTWPEGSLDQLPAALLDAAVQTLCQRGDEPALEQLWRRFPSHVFGELQRRSELSDLASAASLLNSAPPHGHAELLRWLAARVASHGVADPLSLLARQWLQGVASQPGPERLTAYALLAEVQALLLKERAQASRA